MTRNIQDWLNDHIDALLGDRSASPTASDSTTEEHVHLMKAVRQLKLGASRQEPHPDADFVARLEREMLEAMPGAEPKPERNPQPNVVRSPFWNLSWFRPVAGVAAAAAVLLLAVLLLRSVPTMSDTTALAPASPSVMREQAKAPAAAPGDLATSRAAQDAGTESKASGPVGAAAPSAPSSGGAPGVAAAPTPAPATSAAAASGAAAEFLPKVVAGAQTIVVGRVVGTEVLPSPTPSGSPDASRYSTRVIISVERYLKGSSPGGQVSLLIGNPGPDLVAPGKRVLVMTGAPDSNGDLPILPVPEAFYSLTADGQAVIPGLAGRERGSSPLAESDLIARIEAIVKGGQ